MKNIKITLYVCLLLAFQISCTEKELDPPIDPPDENILAEGGRSPAWSPDGKEIAYIYEESLYLMNSDGSNKQKLATDISDMMESPIWSPAGDYMLYIGHSPSTLWMIIRIDANGDNKTILCGDTTKPRLASWSSDGQKIVFTTWNGILAVMNADGTNLHTLTTNVHTPETPRWSPDMNTLLFTKGAEEDRDMYFINNDGSNLIRLPIDSTYETNVQFSIDGTKVFFRGSNYLWGSNIFSVNCDGSGFVNLTDGQGSNANPKLSPDGTKIVFTSSRDGEQALYIMAVDGSGQQRLTELAFSDLSGICWSPDGKKIAFESTLNDKDGIYSIPVDQ